MRRLTPTQATPDYQSLDKLAYTDAVLRESLRLFPPGAIGVREASKDQIIGGRPPDILHLTRMGG